MKNAAKPMIGDDDRRPRPPYAILLVLLLLVAAAATVFYHVYKLTAVPPRLQVCEAKLGPYDYNPLNHTILGLQLNVTLCWK